MTDTRRPASPRSPPASSPPGSCSETAGPARCCTVTARPASGSANTTGRALAQGASSVGAFPPLREARPHCRVPRSPAVPPTHPGCSALHGAGRGPRGCCGLVRVPEPCSHHGGSWTRRPTRPCGALRPPTVTSRRQQSALQGGRESRASTPGGAGASQERGPRVCRKLWAGKAMGGWRWHGHRRACVTVAVWTSSFQDTQSHGRRQR